MVGAGGVGVIVKNIFLDKFKLAVPEWIQLVHGEVACLRLSGTEGKLDLLSVYFPTGGQAEEDAGSLADMRGSHRRSLGNFICDRNNTHTIIGGISIG